MSARQWLSEPAICFADIQAALAKCPRGHGVWLVAHGNKCKDALQPKQLFYSSAFFRFPSKKTFPFPFKSDIM